MISGTFVNIKWTCSFLYILRYKATITMFRRWTWKTNFVLSVISDKGNSKFSMPRWYWDVSGSLKTSHFIPYLFRRDLIISKKMSPSSWWNFHMTFNFFTSHTQQFSTQKSWQNAMSFHMCVCVFWKLKLCYLRF